MPNLVKCECTDLCDCYRDVRVVSQEMEYDEIGGICVVAYEDGIEQRLRRDWMDLQPQWDWVNKRMKRFKIIPARKRKRPLTDRELEICSLYDAAMARQKIIKALEKSIAEDEATNDGTRSTDATS